MTNVLWSLILVLNLSLMVETEQKSIYDYSIKRLNSEEKINLSEYRGKKILFVNVASKCGYTPQYTGLQKLYEEYSDQLVIIGFPCNQFLWQESGTEDKIAQFCKLNYGVTFPITTKINVKGSSKHPIYQWLTLKKFNGKGDYGVSWNFNKFLVDEEGNLLSHFSSGVKPYDPQLLNFLNN